MKLHLLKGLNRFLCSTAVAAGIYACPPVTNAHAQQAEFNINQESRRKAFTYSFRDVYGRTYALDFKIPDKDLAEARQDMPSLTDPRVQQSMKQIQAEIQNDYLNTFKEYMTGVVADLNRQMPQGMSASISFSGAMYTVRIRDTGNASQSERDAVTAQVGQTLDQHKTYIEQKFKSDLGAQRAAKLRNVLPAYLYDFEMQDDGTALFMVDYSTIAGRYRTAMRPLARALDDAINTRDDRQALNATLSFFQSIPYDDFSGRDIGDARMGYVLPSLMLEINKGDCDSKSVAMASTLLTMMPGEKSVIILIPEHALLGVSIRPEKGDAQIKYNGRRYVLMEPAGPGLAPVGMISSKSAGYINSGNYTVKEMFR